MAGEIPPLNKNKMNTYKKISTKSLGLRTTEPFIGESLEDKVRRTTESKEPIEAISPMVYTERKDGVKPEYNIRTDRWDIAQQAMTTISDGIREKRKERMNAKEDKPDTNSEMNAPKNV